MVNIPKLKNIIMMHLRSTRELIINITNCKGFRKLRATYHSVLSKYAETHEQCLLEALEISQEIGERKLVIKNEGRHSMETSGMCLQASVNAPESWTILSKSN